MTKFALVLLASAAMAVPAFAASNPPPQQQVPAQQNAPANQQNKTPQQTNNSRQGDAASQQAKNNGTIAPRSLSKAQIKNIQMALNKEGFDAGAVDGHWGHKTREAIQHMQQMKHLQANGRLDQQTLKDLGVNNVQVAGHDANRANSR
ncbi:peptidoglycan-binding domain-containing protein [Bradyrhizobium sp. RDM4]|jgi:peptidoglycan hydrolase-like protein with peptidoglycan-binding domain|uniref:peptidoglycan-binding domain-containing protein n=1 Tax=Bradyrhizobium sp. RDM4 TaxID=3378765 RepID=UPI0038FBF503